MVEFFYRGRIRDYVHVPPVSANFKPTRRKPVHSPDPARMVSDSGTKAAPMLGSGNRGRVILSVFITEMSQLHFPF